MIPRPRPERFRLRRTMMFMNAQKPGLIKDAYIYGCDSIMLDLEDAVAENQKDAARFSLYHALKTIDYGDTEVIVRINGLDTPHWREDIRVCVAGGVDGIRIAKCESAQDVHTVEKAVESRDVLEGVITEENKGGLVASVKGIRVFIPASQSGKPRGADLAEMVKTRVQLRITEVNRARRRVVGSIRAVAAEARAAAAAAIWDNIEVGKRYSGTVKSLTSYGAFVDIGGVDGMVHISELSWSRIKTPSEVVSVGDPIEVYVISFDPEKKKISLGVKDHSQEPWSVFTEKYSVGDVASVRIVKLMTFGAFAEIVPGVDGLIHISQLADHRVDKPEDVVREGDTVDARITAIDEEHKKVSLSIRALLESAPMEGDEDSEEAPEEE